MVFAAIFYAKKFFKQLLNILCAKATRLTNLRTTVYEANTTDDFIVYHKIINFSKTGVPFRNTLLIRPLHNTHAKLTFLMGVSYVKVIPLHITPIADDWYDLIEELDLYPFAIVLTTPVSPFVIKFVNTKWEHMTGYKSQEVIGKTFRFLQGYAANNDAIRMRNNILINLPGFERAF